MSITTHLTRDLRRTFLTLEIKPADRRSIIRYLDILRMKDVPTYEHSVRVGLLGAEVAQFMHLEPKSLFFAGCLHDIGKALIDPNLLQKTRAFSAADMRSMSKHPLGSYQLLRGVHDFSAEIALRHHRFQIEGYPARLPAMLHPYSEGTEAQISYYARILSLVDFYDAVTHRENEKFGEKRIPTAEKAKEIVLAHNGDLRQLIVQLYANRIFGGEEALSEGAGNPTFYQTLYEQAWQNKGATRTARETRRFVELACALEPMSEKAGCTTRYSDRNPWIKLEYFVVSAINIGDAFEDLSNRLIEVQGVQPGSIYDFAYRAQLECIRNRSGGRINQGIIELLIPIVAAQMLHDPSYRLTPEEILNRAKEVLTNTTREDVEELIRTKRLANDLCCYYDRVVPSYPEAGNVYDYYRLDLQNSETPTGRRHNSEFVEGFPTVLKVLKAIEGSRRVDFEKKGEEAFAIVRKMAGPDVGAGWIADCIAAGNYLYLSTHPTEKIIR